MVGVSLSLSHCREEEVNTVVSSRDTRYVLSASTCVPSKVTIYPLNLSNNLVNISLGNESWKDVKCLGYCISGTMHYIFDCSWKLDCVADLHNTYIQAY